MKTFNLLDIHGYFSMIHYFRSCPDYKELDKIVHTLRNTDLITCYEIISESYNNEEK